MYVSFFLAFGARVQVLVGEMREMGWGEFFLLLGRGERVVCGGGGGEGEHQCWNGALISPSDLCNCSLVLC